MGREAARGCGRAGRQRHPVRRRRFGTGDRGAGTVGGGDGQGAVVVVPEAAFVRGEVHGPLHRPDRGGRVAVQHGDHGEAVVAPGGDGGPRLFGGIGEAREALPGGVHGTGGKRGPGVGQQRDVAFAPGRGDGGGVAVPGGGPGRVASGQFDVAEPHVYGLGVRGHVGEPGVEPPRGLDLPGGQGGAGHGHHGLLDAPGAQFGVRLQRRAAGGEQQNQRRMEPARPPARVHAASWTAPSPTSGFSTRSSMSRSRLPMAFSGSPSAIAAAMPRM